MGRERLEVLLDRHRISERVKELAEIISREYRDKNLLLVCVLKGASIFTADLMRSIRIPFEIGFISASSYRGDVSTGKVTFSADLSGTVSGKDILVVEDIVDTGLTWRVLSEFFSNCDIASLRLCALLDKRSDRRIESIQPDFVGFSIPDKFVVGYGLDHEERYRELPDICALVT